MLFQDNNARIAMVTADASAMQASASHGAAFSCMVHQEQENHILQRQVFPCPMCKSLALLSALSVWQKALALIDNVIDGHALLSAIVTTSPSSLDSILQ